MRRCSRTLKNLGSRGMNQVKNISFCYTAGELSSAKGFFSTSGLGELRGSAVVGCKRDKLRARERIWREIKVGCGSCSAGSRIQ